MVLTGSLPSGTPETFYFDLIAAASCPVILDARGPELLAALPALPRLGGNRTSKSLREPSVVHSRQMQKL